MGRHMNFRHDNTTFTAMKIRYTSIRYEYSYSYEYHEVRVPGVPVHKGTRNVNSGRREPRGEGPVG